MQQYELYNQISREIVRNYNQYLHPEDVTIMPQTEVDKHYTISHVIQGEVVGAVSKFAKELKKIDPSLIFNHPENYHITLFWTGLDNMLDKHANEIQNILDGVDFSFSVEEVLFAPMGISVKFYPKNLSLVETRSKLFNMLHIPYRVDERFVTAWVSVARFGRIPNIKVCDFVRANQGRIFGEYKVNNFKLYVSGNKELKDPVELASFTL